MSERPPHGDLFDHVWGGFAAGFAPRGVIQTVEGRKGRKAATGGFAQGGPGVDRRDFGAGPNRPEQAERVIDLPFAGKAQFEAGEQMLFPEAGGGPEEHPIIEHFEPV